MTLDPVLAVVARKGRGEELRALISQGWTVRTVVAAVKGLIGRGGALTTRVYVWSVALIFQGFLCRGDPASRAGV